MIDWRKIKKMDGHIHIIPDAVHEANPDAEDVWVYADTHKYRELMEKYKIERAVIMPLNDPWLMSMEFTISAVHKNLYEMKKQYPGKFYAFADVDPRNAADISASAICEAIEAYGLDGIKLHPNNANLNIDSEYNQQIFAYAQDNRIPIAIHSYPNADDDPGAAIRIVKVLERYPELTIIVCHMGAFQWEQLLNTQVYVDISAILPDYVRTYGIERTKEILRRFGAERLIFATDYPDNRSLPPNAIYDTYFSILNQMDFSENEVEMMAYGNMERILNWRINK